MKHSLLLFAALAFIAPAAAFQPTELAPAVGSDECSRCLGAVLPGRAVPIEGIRYGIHSDLPEVFTSHGVLYSTRPVLPAFKVQSGADVPEPMRTQRNVGFKSVDGGFEVFMFHIASAGSPTGSRVTVLVENRGTSEVMLRPRQVIINDGLIGTVHEMENALGRRVIEEKWDVRFPEVRIPAGGSALVAASKIFSAPTKGPDSSRNKNCFGTVRVDLAYPSEGADLVVSVVAVPGDPSLTKTAEVAKSLLSQGANSGEGVIDLLSEPSLCQVRRTTGVFQNFTWQSDDVAIDVTRIPGGVEIFQMALPQVQAGPCLDAVQTVPLLLHPPTTRPDTVGNFMVEYKLRFQLHNSSDQPTPASIRFGKKDADVGLGWQVITGRADVAWDEVAKAPVVTGWAGPKQTADLADDTLSFFGAKNPVLQPGETLPVAIRFLVLGNSSLPFQLHVAGE